MGGGRAMMDALSAKAAEAPAPVYGANTPRATPNVYASPYSSQQGQQMQAQQLSPFVQQQLARQSQPITGIGPQQYPQLQMMLNSLFGNQQMPQQQRALPSNYNTQYNPLAYRPNIQQIQQNLGRVQVGVAEQQRRDAVEAARVQAEQDAYNAANPPAPYSDGGGGG